MFYSESAGKMWNRHVKVPKIVPGLLFSVKTWIVAIKWHFQYLSMLIKSMYLKQEGMFIQAIINNAAEYVLMANFTLHGHSRNGFCRCIIFYLHRPHHPSCSGPCQRRWLPNPIQTRWGGCIIYPHHKYMLLPPPSRSTIGLLWPEDGSNFGFKLKSKK